MSIKDSKIRKSEAMNEKDSSLAEYCGFLKSKYRINKKVLFVQLPQIILKSFNPDVAKKKGYYVFPPTGLQYLYESLKTRNLDFKICDLNFMLLKKVYEDDDFNHMQWLSILKNQIDLFDPSIIGVSCMYDLGIQPLLQVLNFLKDQDNAIVITGGVIPTYEGEKFLSKDLCHFVIKGEGENKINYLFDHLLEKKNNSNICSGICYKYQDICYETAGDEEKVIVNSDLVESYSLVKIEEYYKYGSLNPFSRIAGISDSPYSAIQMNRGCRAVCTFCSVRDFMGQGVRKRSVDQVLSEMEFLIKNKGIKHFEWLDDDLLFFKSDFQALLKEIIKRQWKITWSANNGLIAASIDEELMRLIRDSGCIGFKIGIETGNEEMLKKIRKPATKEIFINVARIINKYPEVFVGGNFMIGFPQEKFYQIMDSFKLHLKLGLDWGAFTMCQVIRGASAFGEFEDYFDNQIKSGGQSISNFIPSRESSNGEIATKEKVLKGLAIFKINSDSVLSPEQIKEVWFTFNLVGNYINNKNLKQGGRPEKFISWVEMAQAAYPVNPYMSLFLALAYLLEDQPGKAEEYRQKALVFSKSEYWQERFVNFGIDKVLNSFPQNKSKVFEAIESLNKFISVYTNDLVKSS
ncbi:MAG: B12-binding domain-containing radical SAM protein [Candidatus Omnitrophica bacterium]|nr:B12-binding domain-containing radical SAM protein [Candidatus Omnitrophota bacterium]